MPLAIVEGEGVVLVQEHETNRNITKDNSTRTKNKSTPDLSPEPHNE